MVEKSWRIPTTAQATGILLSLSPKRKAEIRKTSRKVVMKENSSASNKIVQFLPLTDTKSGQQQLPSHLFIL